MANQDTIRVGITHGDINGIGYEVIIKTLAEPHMLEVCTPVIYGSPKVAAYHRKALNIEGVSFNHIRNIGEVHSKRINIINCVSKYRKYWVFRVNTSFSNYLIYV